MINQKIELCYFFPGQGIQKNKMVGYVADHLKHIVFLFVHFLKIIPTVCMYFKIVLYLQI